MLYIKKTFVCLSLFMVFNLIGLGNCGNIGHASWSEETNALKAFPGAEGAGMYTSGGRGGKVIAVTNLQDEGKGSLRDAIEQKGARTIIFRISGTIALQSPLEIKSGDLTVAGQTAPGDGICLKGYPLEIQADNVIIRYIRVRLGDVAGQPFDAISAKNQKNIIIDHCSFSWAVDECASFYDNENFTLQWCIISESLNNSVHPKGEHGYGGIWGGMNASFHHNLLAHHKSRLPRFQGSRYHQMPEKEKAEFCNNVIYNWSGKSSYGGEEGSYNLIGNYYKPGPATSEKKGKIILVPFEPFGRFYLEGNVDATATEVTADNWKGVALPPAEMAEVKLKTPLDVHPQLEVEPADEAYARVLEGAGASRVRDAVDQRIVEEVSNGTCHFGNEGIIDNQDQVGGWPALQSLPAPTDTDQDGMPDAWESKKQLDSRNPDDRNTVSIAPPYTNFEVYLNQLIE